MITFTKMTLDVIVDRDFVPPKKSFIELRSSRRKEERSGPHAWRRNYAPARGMIEARKRERLYQRRGLHGTPVPPKRRDIITKYPLPLLGVEESREYQIPPNRITHANQILNYFGFSEGEDKNTFLISFNGDYQHGADIVRMAYRHAVETGMLKDKLKGAYSETPPEVRLRFIALATSIHYFV